MVKITDNSEQMNYRFVTIRLKAKDALDQSS